MLMSETLVYNKLSHSLPAYFKVIFYSELLIRNK